MRSGGGAHLAVVVRVQDTPSPVILPSAAAERTPPPPTEQVLRC